MTTKIKTIDYLARLAISTKILIFLMLVCGCGKNKDNKIPSANANPTGKSRQIDDYVIELKSSAEFDKLLDENQIVLVDFYADWCGPCHMLKPTIKEIAVEYQGKIKVVAVDIDKFNALASRFKITSIPDIRIFNNATMENSFIGVQPKQSYTRVIKKLLKN